MRLDRSHSGRLSNFGQFFLFEGNSSRRNKKITAPNAQTNAITFTVPKQISEALQLINCLQTHGRDTS